MMIRTRQAGTSLVELLVVIVIFLIGILGVIQVFPAGFQALATTRNVSIANELARKEIERVKGRSDQLAEMILPVYYVQGGSGITILADSTRRINDLGPAGVGINQNGVVINSANTLVGPWQQLSGANIVRRVIGEGGRVPAPRRVGTLMGGLMVLQFAPIVFNANYENFLSVYGNDLVRRYGQPWGPGGNRGFEFWVDEEDENGLQADTLFMPIIPLPPVATDSPYRVSFSFFVFDGTTYKSREVVDITPQEVRNALVVSTRYPAFWTVDVQALVTAAGLLLPGETYAGLDDDTVRVQRNFLRVNAFSANDPYEYQLLDPSLGVMLFNPIGYDYYERRPGGQRVPLLARVNYDVLDWRIIRHEFRVPNNEPRNIKLTLNSLQIRGMPGPDGRQFPGLDFPISNGSGGTQNVDVVIVDTTTGGVLLHDPTNPRDPNIPITTSNDYMAVDPARSSYVVDKSLGLIRLLDADRTTAGLQLRLIYPGDTVPTIIDADSRKFVALYQGRNEWAVQVLKAPSVYQIVFSQPSVAQCYVGGSDATTGGTVTRIFFPGMDTGRTVTIGEIWYTNPSGRQVLRDHDFVITASPADPFGMPYIDIRSVDASAISFDFSNGYAVRTVKGASIAARVLWNPATWRLDTDATANLQAFELWMRNFRKTTVENYLERGEN